MVRFVNLSYELALTWMGFCIPARVAVPTSFQPIDSDKTLQVLRHRHERCRWSTRSSASVEPVAAAGRVEF